MHAHTWPGTDQLACGAYRPHKPSHAVFKCWRKAGSSGFQCHFSIIKWEVVSMETELLITCCMVYSQLFRWCTWGWEINLWHLMCPFTPETRWDSTFKWVLQSIIQVSLIYKIPVHNKTPAHCSPVIIQFKTNPSYDPHKPVYIIMA